MNRNDVFIYIFLSIILILSFLLSLWPLQTSHWWDEAVYLQHSEVIFSHRNNYDEFNLRPPLLSLLIALGYFFKHHVFTSSVIVSLLGTIGVLFIFLLGKELYNVEIGLLSALFLGFSPYMVTASHWIMTDIPSLTFITISFYLLVLASKKNNIFLYSLSGVFFGISILTRFTSLILLFIIAIYVIINKIEWKKIVFFCCGLIVSLLPYLIWAQITYGFFLIPFINAQKAVSDNVGNVLFYIINFLKVYPFIIVLGLFIYIGYLFLLVNTTIKKGAKSIIIKFKIVMNNNINKLDIVLCLWIFIFLIYISIIHHRELRYTIPIAIPAYLLASRGYTIFVNNKNKFIKSFSILFIIILSIANFGESFSRLNEPFINTEMTDAVAVSTYIKSLNQENSVIYANNDYPVYAYYTGMKVVKLEYQDESFYKFYLEDMNRNGFFIYYKNTEKEPSQSWLDSNSHFLKIKEVGNIIVYEYVP